MSIDTLLDFIAKFESGGDLNIVWGGAGRPVLMTGPATTVFTGEIEL